jgi:hypothetical protein
MSFMGINCSEMSPGFANGSGTFRNETIPSRHQRQGESSPEGLHKKSSIQETTMSGMEFSPTELQEDPSIPRNPALETDPHIPSHSAKFQSKLLNNRPSNLMVNHPNL